MSDNERMDEWCLVELMGHRRHAARVREVEIAGAGFLRLDEPGLDDGPGRTLYVTPSSVYALHPTTEAIVRQMARTWRHEPVQRWELPAIEASVELDHEPEGPGHASAGVTTRPTTSTMTGSRCDGLPVLR